MTKHTKKSKLKEMFSKFNKSNPTSKKRALFFLKRAQEWLNAIRNSKRSYEIKFTIAVRQAMQGLTQSELHRVIANEADHAAWSRPCGEKKLKQS